MSHLSWFLMQVSDGSDTSGNGGGAAGALLGGGIFCCVGVFELILAVVIIAGMWKVFVKAGHPGWAAIVPFYNIYILCLIAGKPGWWFILFLIPVVSLVIGIIVSIEIAKKFGKGAGFAVGMVLLPFVFFPMLGFGKATYQGALPPGSPS